MELPQTEHYETKIGYSEEHKRNVYQLVNRKTGVIEYETPVFPQLLTIITQFEDVLETFAFTPEELGPVPDNLVEFKPKQH